MHLFNISDQAKNRLFIAFFKSNLFGILEYTQYIIGYFSLSCKNLNLFKYNELEFNLINNAKIQ
jgi:hypothetical protein